MSHVWSSGALTLPLSLAVAAMITGIVSASGIDQLSCNQPTKRMSNQVKTGGPIYLEILRKNGRKCVYRTSDRIFRHICWFFWAIIAEIKTFNSRRKQLGSRIQ